jgi:hypothetical protein
MADEEATTTDRIRSAEETVATARAALEQAERALHAATRLAAGADRARGHPVLLVVGALVVSGVVTAIVLALTSDSG